MQGRRWTLSSSPHFSSSPPPPQHQAEVAAQSPGTPRACPLLTRMLAAPKVLDPSSSLNVVDIIFWPFKVAQRLIV